MEAIQARRYTKKSITFELLAGENIMRLKNERGIALITALMFTLLSLGIIMLLLYMITQGTKMSGAQKRYKTAVEASYGAADLVAKDIIPQMFNTYSTATTLPNIVNAFSGSLTMTLPAANCTQQKRMFPTSQWDTTVCGPTTKTLEPTISPDMTFKLPSLTGETGYIVFTKITDTRCGGDAALGQKCTNSVEKVFEGLDVGLATSATSPTITPQHLPAYYRIELQAERVNNPREKGQLSVLYAY